MTAETATRAEHVLAPAKLNLFLHINGRRADGYHLLQSVFVLIDWCDELHIELREGGALTREDLGEPLPEHDLTLRAAHALQQAAGIKQGAHIRIAKHIPSQAGMGGGSSDAASTLLALNRLWGLHWPRERLQALGLSLGADVPFFLGGRNAWVEGIGEQLSALPAAVNNALAGQRLLVLKPAQGVETGKIFTHPALVRDTPRATIAGFAASQGKNDESRQGLFGFGRNDLQTVAQTLCPDIANAIDWLRSQGFEARMTGSGSAVFAPMPDTASQPPLQAFEADLARHSALSGRWQMRECTILDVHPDKGFQAQAHA